MQRMLNTEIHSKELARRMTVFTTIHDTSCLMGVSVHWTGLLDWTNCRVIPFLVKRRSSISLFSP